MNSPSKKALKVASWTLPLVAGLMIGRSLPNRTNSPKNSSAENSEGLTASSLSSRSSDPSERTASTSFARKGDQSSIKNELAGILATGDRLERTRMLLDLIDGLGANDFQQVIHTFREEGWMTHNRNEFNFLLAGWMKQDPLAAIDYLNEHEPDGRARRSAIAAWASADPEAAAAAIANLEDGGKVNDWVIGLVDGIARNDPEAALLTLQTIPAGQTRRQAIRTVIPDVVARGPEFANKWIEMIENPRMQNMAARGIAGPLARRDPEAASEWIESIKTTDARRDASEVVSDLFAAKDLEAATRWAESLPHDTMTEAAEGVAKHMARQDPAKAALWLQKLGDDPDLDGARIEFLRESTKRDPQTALEHVSSLSKPAQRNQYYRNILRSWSRNNRAAAIDWAKENADTIPVRVYRSIVPKNQRDL